MSTYDSWLLNGAGGPFDTRGEELEAAADEALERFAAAKLTPDEYRIAVDAGVAAVEIARAAVKAFRAQQAALDAEANAATARDAMAAEHGWGDAPEPPTDADLGDAAHAMRDADPPVVDTWSAEFRRLTGREED